jgi:hypothetical protein
MVPPISDKREPRVSLLTDRLYDKYASHLGYTPQKNKLLTDRISTGLSGFSDLALTRIEGMHPAAHSALAGLLLEKHDEHTINDFLAVMDVMKQERMTQGEMEQYLWSLRVTDELVPQGENGEYPIERSEQCLALVRVMRHMEKKKSYRLFLRDGAGLEYPFISDDKLRQLVIGAGDKREMIVQLILDRNILDAEQLRELCSEVHPSLIEGGL